MTKLDKLLLALRAAEDLTTELRGEVLTQMQADYEALQASVRREVRIARIERLQVVVQ